MKTFFTFSGWNDREKRLVFEELPGVSKVEVKTEEEKKREKKPEGPVNPDDPSKQVDSRQKKIGSTLGNLEKNLMKIDEQLITLEFKDLTKNTKVSADGALKQLQEKHDKYFLNLNSDKTDVEVTLSRSEGAKAPEVKALLNELPDSQRAFILKTLGQPGYKEMLDQLVDFLDADDNGEIDEDRARAFIDVSSSMENLTSVASRQQIYEALSESESEKIPEKLRLSLASFYNNASELEKQMLNVFFQMQHTHQELSKSEVVNGDPLQLAQKAVKEQLEGKQMTISEQQMKMGEIAKEYGVQILFNADDGTYSITAADDEKQVKANKFWGTISYFMGVFGTFSEKLSKMMGKQVEMIGGKNEKPVDAAPNASEKTVATDTKTETQKKVEDEGFVTLMSKMSAQETGLKKRIVGTKDADGLRYSVKKANDDVVDARDALKDAEYSLNDDKDNSDLNTTVAIKKVDLEAKEATLKAKETELDAAQRELNAVQKKQKEVEDFQKSRLNKAKELNTRVENMVAKLRTPPLDKNDDARMIVNVFAATRFEVNDKLQFSLSDSSSNPVDSNKYTDMVNSSVKQGIERTVFQLNGNIAASAEDIVKSLELLTDNMQKKVKDEDDEARK